MLYHTSIIVFDSSKIVAALCSAYSALGSPSWTPASEIIDMMVAAACGDSVAQENWEQHCARRDEKLNREQERKSITHLFRSVASQKDFIDYSSARIQIKSGELRRNQLGKRQSECDGKTTELAAMMPVPPMAFVGKGGQNACTIGV